MEYQGLISQVNTDGFKGVYVNFDGDKSGFIMPHDLKLTSRQKNKFASGKIPECLQVGKIINVKIIRSNGQYNDLKMVQCPRNIIFPFLSLCTTLVGCNRE
jgi:hypothetical protein